MHSVRRVKTTAEQKAAKRAHEAGEIRNHQKLLSTILERNTDPNALNRTTDLLSYYPEQYTVWNIRREILGTQRESDQYLALLGRELKFTQQLLPYHPKVYWIWNHRRWVLDQLPPTAYQEEMLLTTKLLERDARNFHGWNYRWYVLNRLVETPGADVLATYRQEFAYTTKKINENFSNYSAWHYRAQLIQRLGEHRPPLAQELGYVDTAVSMDPADQSGWLYLQWLLESPIFKHEVTSDVLKEQHELVEDLLEEESSVFAARTLSLLNSRIGKTDSRTSPEQLAKLDPLRRHRYTNK